MYESCFGFTARPFAAAPQANRYFPAEPIEHARQALARVIERAEGPALVVGPAGTGKSLLCQVLAQQFANRYRVASLANARLCTRRALLQNILFELDLPYREMEEGELRLALTDHLEPHGACPHGLLLIVDEAHTLPLRLLEELRLLTNLIHAGQPRVRLVLAGGPALEERFASPKLESFNQRLAARCYLHSLSRDETFSYIRWQIDSVGGKSSTLLADDALQAAYTATDGIPRLLNQLFDHTLFLAAAAGRRKIGADGVQEAWADLQQLPTPWTTMPAATTDPHHIVEFGELDEDAASLAIAAEFDDRPLNAHESEHGLRIAEPDDEDSFVVRAANVPAYAAPTTKPEVELVFAGPHDPFGDAFEEEEVVVDHYASLQTRQPDRRIAARREDAWVASLRASLSQVSEPTHVETPHREAPAAARAPQPTSEPPGREERTDMNTPPEPHEQLNVVPHVEESPHEPEGDIAAQIHRLRADTSRAVKGRHDQQPRGGSPIPHDDRDLIVVAERGAVAKRLDEAIERAGQRTYRQLFAKLRSGS